MSNLRVGVRRLIRALAKMAFMRVPRYCEPLKEFCHKYLDRYNNDNDSDPNTNGEHAFLRRFISATECPVVFDVGANIGEWTSFLVNLSPRAIVHCFEPSRVAYESLAARQWEVKPRLNRCALGDRSTIAELQIFGPGSGLNSLYERKGVPSAEHSSLEVVEVITGDDYCRNEAINIVDLVKIDVEGHELQVLLGMKGLLSEKRVEIIQFEYGGCNLDSRTTLADLWTILNKNGYNVYKIWPDYLKILREYRSELDTFRYSNFVAIASTVAQDRIDFLVNNK